jgi:uncharacterized damage-inducible protein DinB
MMAMTTQQGSVQRAEPSTVAGEREMLEGWLDYHRATLAAKCEGLDDAQLRERSAAPSELSLLGLVRHMAEVESGWFRNTVADEKAKGIYYDDADPDGDFHVGESDTYAEAYAVWQAEIAHAREVSAPLALDDVGAAGRLSRHSGEPFNLRWVYTHMIEEYARHNGHADLLRQRIDGKVGQ